MTATRKVRRPVPANTDTVPTKVFINLPVRDLPASMEFFRTLGFSFDVEFTNDEAACMVVSDTIYVMLITHGLFQNFTTNPIADAKAVSEVLVAFSVGSREAVDAMVASALAAGARPNKEPQDHGFMYAHSFHDLDGHIWEPLWLDPSK